MESAKVVGYGPKAEVFPYIPEFLIIDSCGSDHKLKENGEVNPAGLDEEIEAVLYPADLQHDKWCAIEEDRTLTWFNKADKKRWVSNKATALVKKAKTDPDPMHALALLRAASIMCGFELFEFIGILEQNRQNSSESLEQIFKRLDIKMPGQK